MLEGSPVAERLGHPSASRLLVIHADDFGMSHSVNRATMQAFENHWITSSSIMVTCPWFPEAAKFAKRHPEACLGVHLTLNSEWTPFRWGPVSRREAVPSLLDNDGYLPLIETEVIESARIPEVEMELRAQVETARSAGIEISHLDTHMLTLFGSPELFSAYRAMSQRYRVPIRVGPPPTFEHDELTSACKLIDSVCEAVPSIPAGEWLEGYKTMLSALPPGTHQLTLHLGFDDAEMRGATHDHPNWGSAWRQRDFELIQNESFRQFLKDEGFIPVSWRDLTRALDATSR